MRSDRPSLTAALVAFARGVGTGREAVDPTAAAWLPTPAGTLASAAALAPPLRPALRGASCGLVDHVTLRMSAIDGAIYRGLQEGARQLVLLGAGLDGRAWRMEGLADVDVFEVDHPATQAYKRTRAAGRPHRARRLCFVPTDFERARLEHALERAGHDATIPTVWVWEGVTMYLPRVAVIATLGQLDARSARGSRLALTYAVPDLFPLGGVGARRLTQGAFRALGEPLVGAMPPKEVASLLSGASFRVEADTCSADWAHNHRSSALLPLLFRAERLAVAVHDGR